MCRCGRNLTQRGDITLTNGVSSRVALAICPTPVYHELKFIVAWHSGLLHSFDLQYKLFTSHYLGDYLSCLNKCTFHYSIAINIFERKRYKQKMKAWIKLLRINCEMYLYLRISIFYLLKKNNYTR